MKIVMFSTFIVFFCALACAGWVVPVSGATPESYEAIMRSDILRYESLLTTRKIEYRSGYYASLSSGIGQSTEVLKPGTIILYRTNQNHYGKMKIMGYANDYARGDAPVPVFCDVPFFLFTTYDENGEIFSTGSRPSVHEPESDSNCCALKGVEEVENILILETINLKKFDYAERPGNGSYMWFHFDFDTNETSVLPVENPPDFPGADLFNVKKERYSRFTPINGARFLVVYQP